MLVTEVLDQVLDINTLSKLRPITMNVPMIARSIAMAISVAI
jgi:hypothetical protein